MDEHDLIQSWVEPHLVRMNFAEMNTQQVLWGKMEKKILLISKSLNAENDTALIQKVIALTQDFSNDSFAFIQQSSSFSLLECNQFFGAEKIILFGFTPAECSIYLKGITDEPFELQAIQLCFFPSIEKCVTDAVYKKRFAQFWLKILNTKWIQK
jgi:hypothetical protein